MNKLVYKDGWNKYRICQIVVKFLEEISTLPLQETTEVTKVLKQTQKYCAGYAV